MHLMDDIFPYVYTTCRFNTNPDKHCTVMTPCNGNGKIYIEKASDKVLS